MITRDAPALIALLDWDGTLRQGYTLQDWIKFLNREGEIAASALAKFNRIFQKYFEGLITHDQLAESTASLYACALRGQDLRRLNLKAEQFITTDRTKHFWYTRTLIQI